MLTERLKQIIQDSGLSLPRFSALAGVSKNTLTNYRDGVTVPDADFIVRVCREFSINPGWLLMGEGVPYAASGAGKTPAPGGETRLGGEDYVMVPQLESRVTAGPEGEILYEEIADHYPFKRWWLEKLVGKNPDRMKELVLVRVRGDSMSPTINQGEAALVDTHEGERLQVQPGRIYMVILPDGTVAMKRLVLSGEGERLRLVCLSDNTAAYRPFEFALDADKPLKRHILGRVRWVGKEID